MSDPVIKGAKRSATRPTSQSVSSRSSAKSRKLTAKSARPQPKPKRAAEKAPVRKATPVKKSKAAPVKSSAARTPVKASRLTSKQTKLKPATKKAKAAPSPKKVVAKSRTTVTSKAKAAPKPQPVRKGTHAQAAKARSTKAVPAAKPKPAPPPPRKPTVDEAAALKAFERAHKEFTRGRFADARGLFRALIEQHSGVVEVTARARTYLTIAEARLRTEATIPRDAESLYDRGVIELNRGEYVAAQEMFERAIKREPESPDSHYALAATRARLGSVEFALQSLERALELKPALRVRAQHDPDLTPLRNEPEFERIVYAAFRS